MAEELDGGGARSAGRFAACPGCKTYGCGAGAVQEAVRSLAEPPLRRAFLAQTPSRVRRTHISRPGVGPIVQVSLITRLPQASLQGEASRAWISPRGGGPGGLSDPLLRPLVTVWQCCAMLSVRSLHLSHLATLAS